MSEVFLSERIAPYKTLCISELSQETLASHPEMPVSGIGSELYLYVVDDRPKHRGITVLANMPSYDAAYYLFDSVLTDLKRSFSKRRTNLK